MSINIRRISIFLCFLTIFSYVVLGNCATFNLGDRFPVKVAEIISLFTIVFLIIFNKKIKIDKFSIMILTWVVLGSISAIINTIFYNYSMSELVYGLLYGIRIIHLVVLCMIISSCLKKYEVSTKKVIDFIILNYIIVCVIGFIQLLAYPVAYDFYNIFYRFGVYFANPDPHVNRLISTYFDPNYLSLCLLIPLSFSIVYWIKYKSKKYLLYIAILLVTILLTVSRSGILGVGVIFTTILILYIIRGIKTKKMKISIISFYIVIILLIIISLNFMEIRVFERIVNSATDLSTMSRFRSWEQGIEIIKSNPVIGIGYNLLGIYNENIMGISSNDSTAFGNDSSIVQIITTTGIIGSFFFVICSFIHIKSLFKQFIINEDIIATISIIFSALVCCNFNNLLFYILWLFVFLMIVDMTGKKNVEVNNNENINN